MNSQYLRGTFFVLILTSPLSAGDEFSAEQKNHWAWKPPVQPALPEVRNAAWVRNSIDRFILARLEAAGLPPTAPATREQLLRRVTFDLIGLPPTPGEIDAFVNDTSPNAWDKVLDRLLANPHYGERWGRHWLDLARYAESNGYEHDEVRPDAWRYRDYVIRSLNADKPYNRFIQEQLAGDELYPGDRDALIATAFNLLGPDMTDAADQAQRRLNTLSDMTDTTSLAFLGMTVACARCHDHKFEPILQTDYYRLQAFFEPAAFRRDLVIAAPEQRAAHDAILEKYQTLTKPTRDALFQLEEPYRKKLHAARLARLSEDAQKAHHTPEAQRTPEQQGLVALTNRLIGVSPKEVANAMTTEDRAKLKVLQDQLRQFDRQRPPALPITMGLQDAAGVPPKTFLLERGELSNRATEVHAGYPLVLLPGQQSAPAHVEPRPASTGRRTALANWIASPKNPLTARVLVNRLWQHHFGRGLVPTASDFGLRGERPTHPELLDHLADELIQRGWSLKSMHRLMFTSATYQQATTVTPQARTLDPDNRLFSRMNRLRLEGEIIRDSLLAISGRLNPTMGGPGVSPPIPPEAIQGFKGWTVSPNARDHVRRSVYIFARRNLRFPFLESFDLPDSNLSCPKRERSTTAPQALALLNAGDVTQAAEALTARLKQETRTEEEAITQAYRQTLGRLPTPRELERARAFLGQSPLRELCRGLFNVNEFVYLD